MLEHDQYLSHLDLRRGEEIPVIDVEEHERMLQEFGSPSNFSGRLEVFKNILEKVKTQKENLKVESIHAYWGWDEQAKESFLCIPEMDEQFIYRWNMAAFRIYAEELCTDPVIKQDAERFLSEFTMGTMTSQELAELYDRESVIIRNTLGSFS